MADKDELLDSDYDGIKEFDNDLPRWWVWLFIATIIYSGIYIVWYHYLPGNDTVSNLAQDIKTADEVKKKAAAEPSQVKTRGEEELQALSKEALSLSVGQNIFTARCAVCHGPQAQGLVGPNLTDKFWLHGKKLTEIRAVVENGVLEKGMLSWKGQLSPDEIDKVVAYVWSLQGTNPPNPKAPQGTDG